jgi:uncharacterized protein (DUF3084 family)
MKVSKEVEQKIKLMQHLVAQKNAIEKEEKSLNERLHLLHQREKDIRSKIFKLESGKAFGEIITWGNSSYEIRDEYNIMKTDGAMKTYYAPALRMFLRGQSSSPISLKPINPKESA